MSHRRSVLLLVFVALSALSLTVVSAQAQSKGDTTETMRPALRAGGWGLQYKAESLEGTLSGFQGSLFSGRYHLSSRSVVRAGVSLTVSSSETDDTHTRTGGNGPDRITSNSERDVQVYGFFGQYLRYFKASERFFVFAGAGPHIGFGTTTQDATDVRSRDGMTFTERSEGKTTTYQTGVEGTVGAEWFVHPNISLSVEYPIRFEYTHSDSEDTDRTLRENGSVERESKSDRESTQYRVSGQSVRIGITFSFGP